MIAHLTPTDPAWWDAALILAAVGLALLAAACWGIATRPDPEQPGAYEDREVGL